MTKNEDEWTTVTASCGHETAARLSANAVQAAIEITQLATNACIPCYKAARLATRNITWADVNRS
jgi:hypothetical protein